MEITDFLYTGRRRGWGRSLAAVALAVVAWGCAGAYRQSTDGPVSVPARPVTEAGEAGAVDEGTMPAAGVHHVVQPGQTLWRIARTYGLTPEELARANGIADPTRVPAGALLFVPGASRTLEVPPYPAAPDAAGSTAEEPWAEDRPATSADWGWPVEQARILSYFGARRGSRRHAGVDIGGDPGQPVLAARSGRVVYSGSGMRGYGKTVIIDHGDGLSSLYAHNMKLLVRVGQRVAQGDPVARIGRTGNATTEHCHFEIRREDRPVDPLIFLAPTLEAHR